ncbi:MAG: PQQ-binding-like beta-propeller repeat protein, partial [Bacteroidales bacterium]|nr:PQQ-binding-like beta-propeller repeat protein [Bacteroidales bacterium]
MRIIIVALSVLLSVSCKGQSIDYDSQWPQFRGVFACGVMDSVNLPDYWNVDSGENIHWKILIPGLGFSCPVVWDDKIFITTAISGAGTDSLKVGLYGDIGSYQDQTEHEFRTICIDKNSGDIIWNVLSHKGEPKTRRHTKASHANPTCATDGEYVVAFFGSEGLYCYNLDGELQWKKDLGKMNAGYYRVPDEEWGFASSPILHEKRVVVQCDFIGESFIASYDVKTGEQIWRTPRKDVPSWSTPNLYAKGDNKQIVANGYHHIGGYNFETGEEIWKLDGGGDIPVPTPFFAHNLIYIHSAHGKLSPIYAIKPSAKGEISMPTDSTKSEYIQWSIKRGAAYNPTNIVYGNYLYNMKMNGKLSCFDALTGELKYKVKL